MKTIMISTTVFMAAIISVNASGYITTPCLWICNCGGEPIIEPCINEYVPGLGDLPAPPLASSFVADKGACGFYGFCRSCPFQKVKPSVE